MQDCVLKNDELCIVNDGLCIRKDEFCIKSGCFSDGLLVSTVDGTAGQYATASGSIDESGQYATITAATNLPAPKRRRQR